jgi:hypothetical protein
MQYLGFEPKNEWREYSFQVRYGGEDVRDFTLTILNEAFTSRRVRYQDAPDVCSVKLRRELIANPNYPSHTNFTISDTELADYKAGHTPKASNVRGQTTRCVLSRSVISPLSENELELRGMQDLSPSCDHLGGWGSDRSLESTKASSSSTKLTFSASCASFFCLRRSAFSRCFSCLFISF